MDDGSRVLTILLLIVLKTVSKETVIFFRFQKGRGGERWLPLATSLVPTDFTV